MFVQPATSSRRRTNDIVSNYVHARDTRFLLSKTSQNKNEKKNRKKIHPHCVQFFFFVPSPFTIWGYTGTNVNDNRVRQNMGSLGAGRGCTREYMRPLKWKADYWALYGVTNSKLILCVDAIICVGWIWDKNK